MKFSPYKAKEIVKKTFRDRCYDFLNIFAEKILIITLVFEKNANVFAKNWEKSQKIVIITSTPGRNWKSTPRANPTKL
jgi:hypothetical protein